MFKHSIGVVVVTRSVETVLTAVFQQLETMMERSTKPCLGHALTTSPHSMLRDKWFRFFELCFKLIISFNVSATLESKRRSYRKMKFDRDDFDNVHKYDDLEIRRIWLFLFFSPFLARWPPFARKSSRFPCDIPSHLCRIDCGRYFGRSGRSCFRFLSGQRSRCSSFVCRLGRLLPRWLWFAPEWGRLYPRGAFSCMTYTHVFGLRQPHSYAWLFISFKAVIISQEFFNC